MKKLLTLLIVLIFIVSALSSCDKLLGAIIPDNGDNGTQNDDPGDNNTETPGGNTETPGGNTETPGDNNTETPGGSTETPGGSTETTKYTYTDFTMSEKKSFADLFGETLPFISNNEYYLEEYTYDNEKGLNFYTYGNTEAEFEAYLEQFSSYTFDGSEEDEYGDAWYFYSKDNYYVDISYYESDEGYVVDVYAYVLNSSSGDDNTGDNNTGGSTDHLYTDFTEAEKEKFINLFGEVIPFIPNSEYAVDDYYGEGEYGLGYYTFGNTESEFENYLEAFSSYTYDGTYEDDYGDTWYMYSAESYMVDISFYYMDDYTVVDVYIYVYGESSGGNEGGGEGSIPDDVDLITNDGIGLPEGSDGVYDVDFTASENVKDVTDQGYYIDGCPTVGRPAVLVIPVEFSDITAASKNYSTAVIAEAFKNNGATDYHSVYDYYYISSYGKLELDITVLDYWFKPSKPSTYYASYTEIIDGQEIEMGDQLIMDEALAYLEDRLDLTLFDSDGNSMIDAVVLINTLDIGEDNFHWAYRYWNFYTSDSGEYFEYDGVSANDYLWASYQFLYETADKNGDVSYDDTDAVNTYTFIHEFGHILGVDDYYDTAGVTEPMGGCDVMDGMAGDHNAFTKFNLGWLTSSRLVVTDSSVTLTLEDFSESGDTIIIANNFDPVLGAYQEYFIVVYYKNTGLNTGAGGYFERDGILVYHINASLYKEEIDGEIYYDIYNNNTDYSDDYGTKNNLIEYVLSQDDTYTYVEGDTLTEARTDSGEELIYSFTVDSLGEESATLTFNKAA